MSEGFVTIVFLVLLVLVPVGIVVGIVLAVARRVAGTRGLASLARARGWVALGRDEQATEPLRRLLEPTLFAMQGEATHRLSGVVRGRLGEEELYLARYSYGTSSPSGRMGRGGTYGLAVLTRPAPGPVLWLHWPQAGPLGRVVEGLGGVHLTRAAGEHWSWALVSDPAAAARMDAAAAGRARAALHPGGFLFLFEGLYVTLSPGEPTAAWAGAAAERLGALVDVHTP